MIIELKLFAMAKQLAQTDSLRIEVAEPATVGQLRARLVEQTPELSSIASHLLIAVDSQYANDDTPISPDADVACFPPVSGG